MCKYDDFKEFKDYENLDQITMLEIYLTWYNSRESTKMSFKEFLTETDKLLEEIEENVKRMERLGL